MAGKEFVSAQKNDHLKKKLSEKNYFEKSEFYEF